MFHPIDIYRPTVLKLPEVPKAEFPQIGEIRNLEKIVDFASKFHEGIGYIDSTLRGSIENLLELKDTPKPFFWQINKIAKLEAKSSRSHEAARVVTEALKGMGILRENFAAVLYPGYSLGLLAFYKMRIMEKVIEVYCRITDADASQMAKILAGYGDYNQITYDSVAKIFQGVTSSYKVFSEEIKGGRSYKLIEERARKISKREDRKNAPQEENFELARQELIKEDIERKAQR